MGKGGRQGGSKQAHWGWWRENNIIDNYNNHKVVPVYLVVGFSNGVISNDLVSISNGQCENTLILALLDDFACFLSIFQNCYSRLEVTFLWEVTNLATLI